MREGSVDLLPNSAKKAKGSDTTAAKRGEAGGRFHGTPGSPAPFQGLGHKVQQGGDSDT